MQFIQPSDHQRFFRPHLQDWILYQVRQEPTSLEFGIICWSLWRTRNDRVFAGKITTSAAFIQRVWAWINVVRNALDKDRLIHQPSLPMRTEVEISWKPPPPEWVTLNSNGSVHISSGHAAAGGLIRDPTGRCLAAYAINLGSCSITRAELRGAVEGLQVAWDTGFRRVRVELDSLCAVQLLNSLDSPDHQQAAIIQRFKELLIHQWEVVVSHIFREGNKCADHLASRGHLLPLGYHSIPCSDPTLCNFIMYDCQGLSEPRLVLNEG
ncbi:unnamed protein product [Linum trigynum]|uniref:RNase H type-1 domain-containing protein n=1 Tax=Linum trigynum TaxID=586398 RepID=A0AAV2CX07_9ROSI